MMHAKLFKKGLVFVEHEVIKADAASDENFLYTRDASQPAENADVFAVVNLYVGAGFCAKTFSVCTGALCLLLFTCVVSEVCSWTADVVDVALKIGEGC